MNKQEVVAEKYFHIDNGGFFVRVDKYSNIEIDFGFFGYSNTTIFLSPKFRTNTSKDAFGPEELGKFLIEAAILVKVENNKTNK